ncbi:MAG: SDR family oxidoreductase [Pseudomonadota bacterium]
MSHPLRGKHYLLTGASSGIGKATARRLADLGARLTSLGRRHPDGLDLDAHVNCDLSMQADIEATCKSVIGQAASLDGCVLAHGYGKFGGLEEFSDADICRLVQTNFTSCAQIIKQMLPVLKRGNRSDLILIGSEAGVRAGKKGAVYSATKFALRGLAQALRSECQSAGVRISCINPGMVDTPFFDDLDFTPGESRDNALLPDDVAEAIANVLMSPGHVVYDEINLTPQKNVIRNRKT